MGNNRSYATLPMMQHADVQPPMLRLRHGSSDDAGVFLHRPRVPSALATVGASLGCDWTVRAAGVPPTAFAIRSDGGMLSLCPSPGACVFVDGRRAPPSFRPIAEGSRIDVGLLRIEVLRAEVAQRDEVGEKSEPTDTFVVGAQDARVVEAQDARPSLPEMACVLGRAVKRRVRLPWAMLASVTASAALYVFLLRALD